VQGGQLLRIKAKEMVGVRLTTTEIRRLLDSLSDQNVTPGDDLDIVALERKLRVMLQVAAEVDKRPAPWDTR
jgi:hypothetical protein